MSRVRAAFGAGVVASLLLAVALGDNAAPPAPPTDRPAGDRPELPAFRQARLRQPIALALIGDRAYVANRKIGSLSVVDLAARKVVAEIDLGKRLSDVRSIPGTETLLVVDDETHELLLLDVPAETHELAPPTVGARLGVAAHPVKIAVADDGSRAAIASLWSRRLTLVKLFRANDDSPPTIERVVDLPFAPRETMFVAEGRRVVVADAFSGRLAIVDAETGKLLSEQRVPGHNIRGLALDLDGRDLLVSHQFLDAEVHTDHERVFWGNLMQNFVRSVPLRELADDAPDRTVDYKYPLGRPGSATGDPASILVTAAGQTVIALEGIGELAIRTGPTKPFLQRKLGKRPVALALMEDGRRVVVADASTDSLAILDLDDVTVGEPIPLGPPREPTLAERGERLFHDATLSLDGWFSCHSCHTDGHSNGSLNDNLGDASFGAAKRVLSVLGTDDTAPFAWRGITSTLDAQVRKSLQTTMQADHVRDDDVTALVAYLKTLESPPGIAVARGAVDRAAAARGRAVFESHGCAACHAPPHYTSEAVHDVGLSDDDGHAEFNPPSLRGVSQRDSFFHDNRAATLRAVFEEHRHPNGTRIAKKELADLLAFLESL
ncbi:MAG: cytochrome c peroxidase [Planctomycetaceae bacterium]